MLENRNISLSARPVTGSGDMQPPNTISAATAISVVRVILLSSSPHLTCGIFGYNGFAANKIPDDAIRPQFGVRRVKNTKQVSF